MWLLKSKSLAEKLSQTGGFTLVLCDLVYKKRGCHLITKEILTKVPKIKDYKVGLANLFIQHTSASLSINENCDSDVRLDLEDALNYIAPESNKYRHDAEGSDDMPAHVKSTVVGVSLNIPITNGALNLGTWQMSKANEANRSKEPKPTQTISDEQKQRLKRQLELEAYCALISAFRAQGELTWQKEVILQELRTVLHVSDERHRLECLRVQSDEVLTVLGDHYGKQKRELFSMPPVTRPTHRSYSLSEIEAETSAANIHSDGTSGNISPNALKKSNMMIDDERGMLLKAKPFSNTSGKPAILTAIPLIPENIYDGSEGYNTMGKIDMYDNSAPQMLHMMQTDPHAQNYPGNFSQYGQQMPRQPYYGQQGDDNGNSGNNTSDRYTYHQS